MREPTGFESKYELLSNKTPVSMLSDKIVEKWILDRMKHATLSVVESVCKELKHVSKETVFEKIFMDGVTRLKSRKLYAVTAVLRRLSSVNAVRRRFV